MNRNLLLSITLSTLILTTGVAFAQEKGFPKPCQENGESCLATIKQQGEKWFRNYEKKLEKWANEAWWKIPTKTLNQKNTDSYEVHGNASKRFLAAFLPPGYSSLGFILTKSKGGTIPSFTEIGGKRTNYPYEYSFHPTAEPNQVSILNICWGGSGPGCKIVAFQTDQATGKTNRHNLFKTKEGPLSELTTSLPVASEIGIKMSDGDGFVRGDIDVVKNGKLRPQFSVYTYDYQKGSKKLVITKYKWDGKNYLPNR